MEEGRPAYHPALLLKVWLYAYALGVTSARRLEQRVREDLAFRYLAAGAGPDFWTLNQFRTRHARALNDLFTQVVELARSLGMGRLGHVAMDSTRVAANASRDRVETVERRCRERPQKVSADSGFFCLETIVELAQRGLDIYVPDSNLARELNRGQRAPGAPAVRHPEHRRMRRKLRDPAGRAVYQRRKAIVEPVIGVLKEQRGMRQFRRRGLGKVAVEFALAATAFNLNLTRLWRNKPKLDQEG